MGTMGAKIDAVKLPLQCPHFIFCQLVIAPHRAMAGHAHQYDVSFFVE